MLNSVQGQPLGELFYSRAPEKVARDLLGQVLVRRLDGVEIGGRIVETEAYDGPQDQASHARFGRTRRNALMFGPPGRAYIYFTYGMHWCLNVVTGPEGEASAVLIRSIEPTLGLEVISARRDGRPRKEWTNGPAKLCKALAVDGSLLGADLTDPLGDLFILQGDPVPPEAIRETPRIGIGYAGEPWRSIPWRFVLSVAAT